MDYKSLSSLKDRSRTVIEELSLENDHPGITEAVENCTTPGEVKKMMGPYRELFTYIKESRHAAKELCYHVVNPHIIEDLNACRSIGDVDRTMRSCRILL